MVIPIFAVAISAFVIQTVFIKIYNEKYMFNMACYSFFYLTSSVLTVALLLIFAGGMPVGVHPETIILGISFGMLFVFTIMIYGKAMRTGPLSYTTLLFSAGLVIPVVSGLLFFKESMNIVQIIGFILILVTFYIVSAQKENHENGKVNLKWLILAFLTFLCNGFLGLMSKTQQYLLPDQDKSAYLMIGFTTGAVMSLAILLYQLIVKRERIEPIRKPGLYIVILGIGITNALGNRLVMDLISKIPAGMLFPILSGSVMLLVILVSGIIFAEKITFRKVTGIAIGLGAIIMLSLK